jgi:signal transduction histidine kinase
LEVIRTYEKVIGENEIGDLTYSFELMRDELKSKQLREEKLKKSQQELISCISHDLKTPISTIKAYSEGLRDGIAKTQESREDYVRIIIGKTDLLIGMINELLEYSNAQLNQMEINRRELYFYEYFYPVLKELGGLVHQKDIAFSYEIKTPDMLLYIDPKRITEVLYNLVENSIKYTREKDGKIVIKAERERDCILIKVIDNGIGISPDDIPYVFDKFYRAEKSRSSSIPGSGLGLSICKYIVNEHGGEIYCKSRHHQGCEIGFTLPVMGGQPLVVK